MQNPSNNPVKLEFLEKHLENIIDLISKYDLVDLINAISKVAQLNFNKDKNYDILIKLTK